MKYIEVVITTDPIVAEQLVDLLASFAEGGSVAIEQLGNPEDLNPTAMMPESAVKFWYSEDKDSNEYRQAIQEAIRAATIKQIQFTPLENIDWTTEWRKNYKPILAGEQFVILPPWEPNEFPSRIPLLIDPGIAFGTGQHETTRLCLAQLEQFVSEGMQILDLGAGSAILSMACAHLGAGKILGVEIDEDAVKSAAENLKLNYLASKVDLIHGGIEAVTSDHWDLIVANILAVILIDLIQHDGLLNKVKPGGRIIFSGIIDQQLEAFQEVLTEHTNYKIENVSQEGEWVAITVMREN